MKMSGKQFYVTQNGQKRWGNVQKTTRRLQKTTEQWGGGGGGGGEKKKDMEIKGIEEEIKRRVLSYFPQKIAFNFSS